MSRQDDQNSRVFPSKAAWLSLLVVLLGSLELAAGPEETQRANQAMNSRAFREEFRIAPESSEPARILRNEVQKMIERLLPEHDFTQKPFRVEISDESKISASIATEAEPPVIILSTGLLRSMETPDQLAFVLAHELTHFNLYLQFGSHRNSKGEEYASDTLAVSLMNAAGFDPREALKALKKLEELEHRRRREKSKIEWVEVLDVHGVIENRISAVEKALANESRSAGGITHTASRFDPSFRLAATQRMFEFEFQNTLVEGFDELSLSEQITRLMDAMKKSSRGDVARWRVIREQIDQLDVDTQDATTRGELDLLANALIKRIAEAHSQNKSWEVYQRAFSSLSDLYPTSSVNALRPQGDLLPFARAAKKFVEAESPREAEEAAQQMRETYERDLRNLPSEFLQQIRWPNFKLPDPERLERQIRRGEEVEVSWNRHVDWSSRPRMGPIILDALEYLNVMDRRLLMRSPSYERAQRHWTGELRPISPGPQREGNGLLQYQFDEEGIFTGYDSLRSNADRIDYEKARDMALRSAISTYLNRLFKQATEGSEQARSELLNQMPILGESSPDPVGLAQAEQDIHLFLRLNPSYLSYLLGLEDYMHSEQTEHDGVRPAQEELQVNLSRRAAIQGLLERISKDPEHPQRDGLRAYFLPASDAESSDFRKIFFFNQTEGFPKLFLNILKEDTGLFTNEEKLFILGSVQNPFTKASADASEVSEFYDLRLLATFKELLGLSEISTVAELLAQFQEIFEFEKNFTSSTKKFKDSKNLFEAAREALLIEFITMNPRARIPLQELHGLISSRFDASTRPGMRDYFFSQNIPFDKFDELYSFYVTAHQIKLFERGDKLPYEIQTRLVRKLEKKKDPRVRMEKALEILLLSRVDSAKLRNALEEIYVEALFEIYGEDRGQPELRNRVLEDVERSRSEMIWVDAESLSSRLANRILSQRELTDEISSHVRTISRAELERSQILGVGVEASLTHLSQDEDSREKTFEFLTSRGDNASLERFARFLSTRFVQFEMERETESTDYQNTSSPYFRQMAQDLYGNFWSNSFPIRALIMDALLFPPNLRNDVDQQEKSYKMVLGRLFPSDERYSEEAREILSLYREGLEDFERGIFVAAMLVAAREESGAEKLTPGEKLALVFEMMGPAETKLGQAISSDPRVPEDLAKGLRRLKHKADVLNRWDLFDLFYETVPPEDRSHVKRVRSILGAASYYVVFEVETQDGGSEVFAVLRKNALKRAEQGFDRMIALANRMEESTPMTAVLKSAIEQARFMAKLETDSQIYAQQDQIAQSLYRGKSVEVGDYQFEFIPVETLSIGPGYRRMSTAPGLHFHELPEETPEQRAFKKALAKAYLTLELSLILRGYQFDHDRHAAQMRVDGNRVYLFDFGAMAIDEPTEEERQLMAEALLQVVRASLDGSDPAESLLQEIRKLYDENGQVPRYLITLQKALLALQDFQKQIPKEELMSVLKTAMETDLHPDFQARFMEAAIENPELLERLQKAHESCEEGLGIAAEVIKIRNAQ